MGGGGSGFPSHGPRDTRATMSTMKAYVFDAYGTLFDVHSAVRRHAEAVGPDAARLSEVWRLKQLEYSWVRGLMGRYRPFSALTEEALDHAFAAVPGANRTARAVLLDAYLALDAYSEVPGVLRALRERGHRTAILSNGSPDMLDPVIARAGLADLLDAVISVDALQTFKTDPRVYAHCCERMGVEPEEVSFQSSNRWDIAGATAFGHRAVWVNRANAPDEYRDLAPAMVVRDLSALIAPGT